MKNVQNLLDTIVIPVCLKLIFDLSVSWALVFTIPILVWIFYRLYQYACEWIHAKFNTITTPKGSPMTFMICQSMFILCQLGGVCSIPWAIVLTPTILRALDIPIGLLLGVLLSSKNPS